MKKPRKKQRLKELIVREIKRYLDDPDKIEAVTAINYKDGTKTVNYNDMECAISARLHPRLGFGNLISTKRKVLNRYGLGLFLFLFCYFPAEKF